MALYGKCPTSRLLFLSFVPLVLGLAKSSSSSMTSWVGPLTSSTGAKHHRAVGDATDVTKTRSYDNSWCFRGLYDYDNCPERETLHDCVRCCYELSTYYNTPPSKNVCIAACSDQFPRSGSERLQF